MLQSKMEHEQQIEQLRVEIHDSKKRSEAARLKLEQEKDMLESELTKVLQELETVLHVANDF